MENPFKADDDVITKIKGTEHSVKVVQAFQNEVQVRTAGGDLLWRTMHTVWHAGTQPIPRPPRTLPPSAQALMAAQEKQEQPVSQSESPLSDQLGVDDEVVIPKAEPQPAILSPTPPTRGKRKKRRR